MIEFIQSNIAIIAMLSVGIFFYVLLHKVGKQARREREQRKNAAAK